MDIWSEILSREPQRIRRTFQGLNSEEKITVRVHLIRMTTEDGWHEAQIASAKAALEAIKDVPDL